MTTTRATLPALISRSLTIDTTARNHTQQVAQTVAIRSRLQQTVANRTNDSVLQFRHTYVILYVVHTRKETDRDHDGRISYSRRGCQNAQDIRGFCDETSATREDARVQDRRFVACGSERVTGVSGKEEEYSRQEINVGVCQYNFQVVHLLSFSDQPADNRLSSIYPYQHYTETLPYASSGLLCSFAKIASTVLVIMDETWVVRKVTPMFTTIDISPQLAYPYVKNYAPGIFRVCGSEVAV